MNAMIDYGTPIPLGPGDYLTVAARDQEGMHLQASDPYEVSTIFLRVKGADLAAYRAGEIDLAEVRKRVEVEGVLTGRYRVSGTRCTGTRYLVPVPGAQHPGPRTRAQRRVPGPCLPVPFAGGRCRIR